ncbi:MAG TPA: hypothetical protein VMS12_09585, partial [Thermoanaerobaculia bacterium]|nr:hypothetical protein [Thermoanaerobaculia bacterium]
MIARVILLEDSEDDLLLVVEALRAHGFQLEWEQVENSESLRRTLAEGQWDAVLCDYSMPHMTA